MIKRKEDFLENKRDDPSQGGRRMHDLFDLSGRKGIVTGAGRGIGKAIAIALAEAGADVAIAEIIFGNAQKTSDEVKKLGRKSFALKTDVTKPGDVDQMVQKTLEEFGRIDILVNNAGVGLGFTPSEECEKEKWSKVIAVNLTGTFLCSQAVSREMIKQKNGKIINLASMWGFISSPGGQAAAYNATKGGIVMLTKTLAAEWAKYNIRVNALAPGFIKTDMSLEFFKRPEMLEKMIGLTPLRRPGQPEDLKGAAIFLASDASNFVTGAIIAVDGGFTIE